MPVIPVFSTQNQSVPPPPVPPVKPGRDEGDGAVVVERQTQKTEPPRLYQVLLQEFFRHDLDTATQIMLKIHHEGRGVCGVFTKDVAATKVELVLAASRRAGHPLQCIMEAA
jgi:ATP-dependent Clp protease adaptor protein ClpS